MFLFRLLKLIHSHLVTWKMRMHMYQNCFETVEGHKLTDQFWYFHKKKKKEENTHVYVLVTNKEGSHEIKKIHRSVVQQTVTKK